MDSRDDELPLLEIVLGDLVLFLGSVVISKESGRAWDMFSKG